MKNILSSMVLILITAPALAADVVYINCNSYRTSGSSMYEYSTHLTLEGGQASASGRIERTSMKSNTTDGVGEYGATVETKQFKVRADLLKSDAKDLNQGEKIIISALKADLEAKACNNSSACRDDVIESGLDLTSVRSLTAYFLTDREDKFERSPIVEVRDGSGKSVGIIEVDIKNNLVSRCGR